VLRDIKRPHHDDCSDQTEEARWPQAPTSSPAKNGRLKSLSTRTRYENRFTDEMRKRSLSMDVGRSPEVFALRNTGGRCQSMLHHSSTRPLRSAHLLVY
jgi:hypothetical protein